MTFSPIRRRFFYCKGNLTIEHNTQILARGIQSILDKIAAVRNQHPLCKHGRVRVSCQIWPKIFQKSSAGRDGWATTSDDLELRWIIY